MVPLYAHLHDSAQGLKTATAAMMSNFHQAQSITPRLFLPNNQGTALKTSIAQ
jgi:hypothetical protein